MEALTQSLRTCSAGSLFAAGAISGIACPCVCVTVCYGSACACLPGLVLRGREASDVLDAHVCDQKIREQSRETGSVFASGKGIHVVD